MLSEVETDIDYIHAISMLCLLPHNTLISNNLLHAYPDFQTHFQ